MKTVTQNIKVELENAERVALNRAKNILLDFMNIMEDQDYYNINFEQFGLEYSLRELENAIDLLDTLSEENPTIK